MGRSLSNVPEMVWWKWFNKLAEDKENFGSKITALIMTLEVFTVTFHSKLVSVTWDRQVGQK